MSLKSLNKSITPVINSVQKIQTTVVKSIVQKTIPLKGDIIVIFLIIASIIILQKLYYFYKSNNVIEGQN